ncbi:MULTISPECIES: hypothetical protein [unclassified Rhizobium]|uniref:hypothetical protein n=1 Tax=unclassified Rhizobium TaxID=2613769 RepID=UPI0007151D48|nr:MULTISPECIES: hypothetical protein [unclassified Rhizobium]KQS89623.1 hypothetical protein ASG42_13115 [Rhizobium sp. Leaf391]KQS94903.1 hypothetical protein ASG50_27065 [Rhizobium sp. Leaf386]KQU01279.1 hypothetical protein ASG68_05845 [Rhizobium sp. Leaf453]
MKRVDESDERSQADLELRETWDRSLDIQGRMGLTRLTASERSALMGIAIREALIWGGIVEVMTIGAYLLIRFTDGDWGNSWSGLLNGPIVVAGYFFWKRRKLLDRSTAMWSAKREELLTELIERNRSK